MMTLREIEQEMAGLNSWSLEGSSIAKVFSFTDFKESLDFVNKIGEIAEEYQHHPDVLINQNNVKLSLTTHSVGGLTKKDFDFARSVDIL